jgi:hypothetical protein
MNFFIDSFRKLKEKTAGWDKILNSAKAINDDLYNLLSKIDNLDVADDMELSDWLNECSTDIIEGAFDLEIYYAYDNCYIGASWSKVKLDETKREFEKRIKEEIGVLLGEEVSCEYLSGEY